ncbi:unnamed protein product [Miscanthus lutarioriparius]|uniref:Uncharacterized protein n=1 Tax=Miscanthus lutarioriparius TaxID=422564 RepID=A0A811NN24_9POAL|nr:unnamed protein product [Miscanthus lutarioriparius]
MSPPPPSLVVLPLLLLLLFAAVSPAAANATATAAAGAGASPPVPTPWPEQFHALMFTNLTASGGRLELIDLYYDWPGGRNLNLIRDQLSGDPLYDVEWTNGTSYFFDSGSCHSTLFPVGLLPPDWLAAGAVYLGREHVDGFDCHLWTKVDFVWYYEEVATGRPVRWNFFNGMQQHVMSFEVGGVLEDSMWQAPAYCFNGGNADTANVAADRSGSVDVMNSLTRFAGAPAAAAAASFDQ